MKSKRSRRLEDLDRGQSPFNRAMQEALARKGLVQEPNPEFDEMLRKGFIVFTPKPFPPPQRKQEG